MSRKHQRANGTGKTLVQCKQCGNWFSVWKCHLDYRPRVFCSRECKTEWQRQNLTGQNNPLWRGKQIKRICQFCGREFFVKPSVLKRAGWGRFCSKQCVYEARHLQFLETNPNDLPGVKEKQLLNWQDPELRELRIRRTLEGLLKRPTSLEQRLIKFFEDHQLPFQYVGDGSFLIGFKNPDFINTNGRKVAIEVSNAFFHRNKPHWAEKRKAHFAKYGWDCIILETTKSYLSDDFLVSTIGKELKMRGIYEQPQ